MEPSAAAATAHSFHKIFNQAKTHAKFRTAADVSESVRKIRRLILVEGIPTAIVRCLACWMTKVAHGIEGQDPALRPRIWKVLLNVTEAPADVFVDYVGRGPCAQREKIRNDTFRLAFLCCESFRICQHGRTGLWPQIVASRSASPRTCSSASSTRSFGARKVRQLSQR
jgi:hypothetical protein